MKAIHTAVSVISVFGSILLAGEALARQNILIGEISIGYDYQEREYDEQDSRTSLAATAGETTDAAAEALRRNNEIREGDARALFATPRFRFSSRETDDLIELSYAPTFTYDDVYSSTDTGHDLNVLAEKNLSKEWLVHASNSYFYGDDTVTDYQRRTGPIIDAPEQPSTPAEVGAGATETVRPLTENYGRREYWRNDLEMRTDYTYAQDSVVSAGYNFGVLRNVSDEVDGYSDYDRHEGIGRLSYRFTRQWNAETELRFVKGIYDETTLTTITPGVTATESESTSSGGVAVPVTAPTITSEEFDDDLEEYHGRLRVNYDWRAHDVFFGRYAYSTTDYVSTLREDSAIHVLTAGWDHDFSNHLRMTLSGGPTFVTFDESDNETGFNAYAGLTWDLVHSAFNASTSYTYEYENFDGRRTGLAKIWRNELGYEYRFTEAIRARVDAGYEVSDHEEPRTTEEIIVIANTAGESATSSAAAQDHFSYQEDSYDVGLKLTYDFLRYYSLSTSYRYANFQSDAEQDYDEHRVLVTLTASTELFRW